MQFKINHIKMMAVAIVGILCVQFSQAQQLEAGKFQFDAEAGTKIGGASPLSLPVEIREIKSYRPAAPFYVGAKVSYAITNKWAVRSGLVFEGKGMKTEANVKAYKTTFNADEDPNQNVKGYYYGDISTNVENLYLTIPVQSQYQLSESWSLLAGPYISFAVNRRFYGEAIEGYIRDETPTGEQIGIANAAYSFDRSIRKVDVGMSISGKYDFAKRYYATAQFDYGFNNIMKVGFESISFPLHNIFMNVGLGIRVF